MGLPRWSLFTPTPTTVFVLTLAGLMNCFLVSQVSGTNCFGFERAYLLREDLLHHRTLLDAAMVNPTKCLLAYIRHLSTLIMLKPGIGCSGGNNGGS